MEQNNNQLQIFKNSEFGNLRVVTINNKEYFYGVDIAQSLGYERPSKAISDHCKGILKQDTIKNDGGYPEKLIPEGDIYRLIMKSKLPSAERFEAWVVDDVLPSIRKHGAYMTEDTIEKALTSPDFLIQLATKLKEEQTARQLAEKKLEEQKPLVDFTNTVLKSKDNILVRELAKVISDEVVKIGQNRLYEKLREWGMVMKNNTEPYQRYIENGYFVLEEKSVKTPYGEKITKTTKVSPRGQVAIVEKFRKEMIQ